MMLNFVEYQNRNFVEHQDLGEHSFDLITTNQISAKN